MEIKTRNNTGKQKVGTALIKQDISYKELLQIYTRQCTLKNLASVTIKGYEFANDMFLKFAGEDLMCNDVTQELIDEYKSSLIERLKPETVNSYVFKVSPIVKFGFKQGYLPYNIEFNHMKEQEHFKEIYTEEELKILLKKPKTESFAEYRNWVIINFLLGTGVRAKELREIRIEDVDFSNSLITLRHTKNRKPRIIPMSNTLFKVLNEYFQIRNGNQGEALFCNQYGEPLCRTTLQLGITKYCKKRGIEKYSLHLFRHTFITMSIKNGVSPLVLKRITGHSNFKMLDNYFNAEASDLVEIVDTFNPLERFKKREKIIQMK